MTPKDQNDNLPRDAAHNASERILDHNRLQLSAFLDGELPADEARFLLRRLQHDDELRECWERWQLHGAVMRGQVGRCISGDFSGRVARAVAAEAPVARHRGPNASRWMRWGGGAALAASVAVVALLLTRQSPDLRPTAAAQAPIADARPAVQPLPPQRDPEPVAVPPAPVAPDPAAQLATAVAVADVPRRLANRRSRGQSQRAAMRSSRATVDAPYVAATAATPLGSAPAPIDPFSGQHVSLPNRPWPRALFPGSPNDGAFNVDYGNRNGSNSGLASPFAPRSAPAYPVDSRPGTPPAPQ